MYPLPSTTTKKKWIEVWGITQAVKHLPGKHKALSLNPTSSKKRKWSDM
jgi:hypothetical protein